METMLQDKLHPDETLLWSGKPVFKTLGETHKNFFAAKVVFIAFALIAVLVVLYDSELFMSDIYKIDIMEYAKKLIFYYLGFTGIYVVISYIVYAIRYRKAKRRLKVYFNNLKRLQILYQRERKDKVQS